MPLPIMQRARLLIVLLAFVVAAAGATAPALARHLDAFRSADPVARAKAMTAAARMGAAAVSALAAALKDENAEVRFWSAFALGEMKPPRAARPAVPALIRVLEESDEGVVRNAAYSLGLIGPAAKSAAPALRRLLKSPNQQYVRNAAYALARLS